MYSNLIITISGSNLRSYLSPGRFISIGVVCLLLFHVVNAWAENGKGSLVHEVFLPSGQVVTVTGGEGEPKSVGSYTIRLYSGKMKEYPFDDFLGGTVRPREGTVEKMIVSDLNVTENLEVVVVMRSAGSGSYLSADAFSVIGSTIHLVETVSGLGPEEDPVEHLAKKVKKKSLKTSGVKDSSCSSRKYEVTTALPVEEEVVTISQIKQICLSNGLKGLWSKIEKDPPPKPFLSDGCSLWFKKWKGVSLYPACFFHDLKYWAGYPGEDVTRLIADAELMIDVACLLDSVGMAETMFQGVRRGGHEMYQQSFSWGFGRVSEEDGL